MAESVLLTCTVALGIAQMAELAFEMAMESNERELARILQTMTTVKGDNAK